MLNNSAIERGREREGGGEGGGADLRLMKDTVQRQNRSTHPETLKSTRYG